MAEERHVEPGAAQAAVAAAIAAAGPAGSNHKAWEARVMALVPHAMAMMNEGSRPFELARQVGEAQVFRVVYDHYEMEESSKRAIVTLVNAKGEYETIRTNPEYTPHGRALIDQLSRLQQGCELLVWKAIETMSGRQDRKVRVLVHLTVLKTTAQRDAPSSAERDGAEEGQAEVPPSPPLSDPSAPQSAIEAIRMHLKEMPPEEREAVVWALKKKGWQSADAIPANMHEKALFMVTHKGEEPF